MQSSIPPQRKRFTSVPPKLGLAAGMHRFGYVDLGDGGSLKVPRSIKILIAGIAVPGLRSNVSEAETKMNRSYESSAGKSEWKRAHFHLAFILAHFVPGSNEFFTRFNDSVTYLDRFVTGRLTVAAASAATR
jgi:hypothetical protein